MIQSKVKHPKDCQPSFHSHLIKFLYNNESMDNNERPIYICPYFEIIISFEVLNFAIYLKYFSSMLLTISQSLPPPPSPFHPSFIFPSCSHMVPHNSSRFILDFKSTLCFFISIGRGRG